MLAELETLNCLPAFASLDAATRERLVACGAVRDVAPDERCFTQGSPGGEVMLLVEGCLKLVREGAAGRQAIVRLVFAGELFGIGPAMGMPYYLLSTIAVRPSRVAVWPSAVWHETLATATASADVLRVMGERLDDAYERLLDIATLDVAHRLTREILRLADQAGRLTEQGTLIDLPLTRQDLAAMTGTTRHNVSRILRRMEAQGLVRGGRRRLLVCDLEGLVRLARGQTTAEGADAQQG